MLLLAIPFSLLSVILGYSFYRKYQARLRSASQNSARYKRIGDYYGTPILLAFEYRFHSVETPAPLEVDVEEIFHYGNDYFLKGHSSDRKCCQIFKWSRIEHPRIRFDGRNLESLEQLFSAADGTGARAAA